MTSLNRSADQLPGSEPLAQRTTETTPQALRAAADTIPADTPIYMLNLLRYRAQADYGESAAAALCSGREAYFQRYIPAFTQVTAGEGIKAFWVGTVLAQLVAPPGEHWDDVAIVEYPSFAAFQRMIESPTYQAEAEPHRRAALEDWRLIPTAKADLPG